MGNSVQGVHIGLADISQRCSLVWNIPCPSFLPPALLSQVSKPRSGQKALPTSSSPSPLLNTFHKYSLQYLLQVKLIQMHYFLATEKSLNICRYSFFYLKPFEPKGFLNSEYGASTLYYILTPFGVLCSKIQTHTHTKQDKQRLYMISHNYRSLYCQ